MLLAQLFKAVVIVFLCLPLYLGSHVEPVLVHLLPAELSERTQEHLEILRTSINYSFSSLTAKGDVDGLYAWYLAGADLKKTGYDGRNPLQVVSVHTAVPLYGVLAA